MSEPGLTFFPVPLGDYRDPANTAFDADAEARGIIDVLSSLFGGDVAGWEVEPEHRDLAHSSARLKEIAKELERNTVIVWVGHGRSNESDASLILPGVVGEVEDDELLPATMTAQLEAQSRRRAHLDPRPWTLVVLEACGAGRFAELVGSELADRGQSRGVALIGIGDPAGRGHTATADRILSDVVARMDANNTVIRLSELLLEVEDRLGEREGLVASCRLAGCVIRRPSPVISATLDVYAQLRESLDAQPPAVRDHFARKGLGSDFGELAWLFVGRDEELSRVVGHLERGTGLLAVTGPAGAGKSAVLGNVLLRTEAAPRDLLRSAGLLPGQDPDPAVAVDLWLHLGGMTAGELVDALLCGLGAQPGAGQGLSERLDALLTLQSGQEPLLVVADALDESRDPEANADILARLAKAGARVVVGSRPSRLDALDHESTGARDLLDALQTDDELWIRRDPDALRDYLEAGFDRDQPNLSGSRRARIVDRVCAGEAEGRQFLFARLLLHELAARPGIDDATLDRLVSGTHRDLFAAALERIRTSDPEVIELLAALAHAQGSGLPRLAGIWAAVAAALTGHPARAEDLDRALEVAAAYIAIGAEAGQAVYRLAHRTFQEHFEQTQTDDQRLAVLRALLGCAESRREDLNPYLVAHLPQHAARAGQAGWEELSGHPELLDVVDPGALAVELARVVGRHSLPPVLDGMLTAAHVLRDAAPDDRRGIRELATAWFTDEPAPGGPPLTWRVLRARRDPRSPHQVLEGHTGAVLALAPLDGGAVLASAGRDGTVRLWDTATGLPAGPPLEGHTDWVHGLAAFTGPHGEPRLASLSRDGTLHIWDPAARRQVGEAFLVEADPESGLVALTPDTGGTLLVYVGQGRRPRVLDASTGDEVAILDGHVYGVGAMASYVSADGRAFLITTGGDHLIRCWNAQDWAGEPAVLELPPGWSPRAITCVRGRDGNALVAAAYSTEVLVLDLSTGDEVGRWQVDGGAVQSMASFVDSDGRCRIVTGGWGDDLQVWTPDGDRVGATLLGHAGRILDIASLPPEWASLRLATAGHDETVRIWTLDAGNHRPRSKPDAGHAAQIGRFTDDSGAIRLFTSHPSQTVRIWDPDSLTECGPAIQVPDDPERMMAKGTPPSPRVWTVTGEDGRKVLVTSGLDRRVREWDPTTGAELHGRLPQPPSETDDDNRYTDRAGRDWVVRTSWDGRIEFASTDTGPLAAVANLGAPVLGAVNLPDTTVIVALQDGLARLEFNPRWLAGEHG